MTTKRDALEKGKMGDEALAAVDHKMEPYMKLNFLI